MSDLAANDYRHRLKLQPLVREISRAMNVVITAGCKDDLSQEFHLGDSSRPKLQPPVAEISWATNLVILGCVLGSIKALS